MYQKYRLTTTSRKCRAHSALSMFAACRQLVFVWIENEERKDIFVAVTGDVEFEAVVHCLFYREKK